MSSSHLSHLLGVLVPSGPTGLTDLRPVAEAAFRGTGPAFAPIPDVSRITTAATSAAIGKALAPDEPLEFDDVVAVVSTSGSTGDPKGVYWTRTSIAHSVRGLHERLGGPGSWVLALPLTSAAGLMALLRCAAADTEAVALSSLGGDAPFTAENFAQAVASLSGRRYTSLIDEQLRRLMTDPLGVEALRSCDAVLVGGGPLSSVLDDARAAGIAIHTSYGMTETCGGCWYDHSPLPDVQIDTTEDGRLRVAGPVVTPGYRFRSDANLQGGTFVTSDLGVIENSQLRIFGRIDDAVKIDGVLVDLAAVERVIREVSARSVVIARVVGDRPGLEVVVEAEELNTQEIVQAVRDKLAARVINVVMAEPDSLPRLPGGKIDVRTIRAGKGQ